MGQNLAITAADIDPEVPTAIGPYRIVCPLGRGGMGVVYRGMHVETGEVVALKTVDVAHASVLGSLRREIHALRRVDHPGVVRIVAEGVEHGVPWYAMELLEGDTLARYNARLLRVTTEGSALRGSTATRPASDVVDPDPLPASAPIPTGARCFTTAGGGALHQTLTLMAAVCDALAFVHGMGLIHRDLKPENVFLRDERTPVLADFGLALSLSGARGRDVIDLDLRPAGSPPYMAPEQIEGDLMDARVDLYALGCMLYESVTGTVPFVGSTHTVLRQHVHMRPPRPSARVSGVPPALDDLILRLLEKRPKDRIGHADDVAAALVKLGAEPPQRLRRPRPYLYRPRLVGRTSILAELEHDIERVRPFRGGRVLVAGESGVGKTRFIAEVAAVATRHGLRVVTGECAAVSTAESAVKAAPLHPFKPLLLALADHCREQGPSETARVLGDRAAVLAAYEPSLALLPGLPQPAELAQISEPLARARLHKSLAGALAAFAEVQPILLVIDDLQWADESTLRFLESLDGAYFARTGVLLVGAYRADEEGADLSRLAGAPGTARVDLGRLDTGAVRRMVSDMLAMPAPPSSFIDFLVAQSQGNPFFIAEYLRVAIDEGVLFRDDAGEWQIAGGEAPRRAAYDALPLPGGLRELVGRQIARLGDGARALARMAAVLGREIDAAVLAAAAGLDDLAHLEAVEELRTRQILHVEGARVRFAHDKLREVVYAEIPEDERKKLHAAAGAAIEARWAGTPEIVVMYPMLVHHFATARTDDDKTLDYLEKAGRWALETGASSEALDLFRRALALDDERRDEGHVPLSPPRRGGIERRLGQAAFNLGRLPEAERFTQTALHRLLGGRGASLALPSRASVLAAAASHLAVQALHTLGPTRPVALDSAERRRLTEAALAAERLAQIHLFRNDRARGFEAALQAANLAEGLGSSPELARAYASLSVAFLLMPVPGVSAAYEARARKAVLAASDPQTLAFVSRCAGATAFAAGRWADAREAFGRSLDICRASQDHRLAETSLAALACIAQVTGRPEDAGMLCDELDAAAEKSGNTQGRLWAMNGQALCRISLGEADEAIAIYERRRALAQGSDEDRAERIMRGGVAMAHLQRGDFARARRVAEDTLEHLSDLSPASFHLILGYAAPGEVLLALWERETAPAERAALEDGARRACRAMHAYARLFPVGRPRALRFEGVIEALSGRPRHAQRAFRRSLDESILRAMPIDEGLARLEIARRLPEGDRARAAHLEKARALFERAHRRTLLARTEKLLAQAPDAVAAE